MAVRTNTERQRLYCPFLRTILITILLSHRVSHIQNQPRTINVVASSVVQSNNARFICTYQTQIERLAHAGLTKMHLYLYGTISFSF